MTDPCYLDTYPDRFEIRCRATPGAPSWALVQERLCDQSRSAFARNRRLAAQVVAYLNHAETRRYRAWTRKKGNTP